MERDNESIKKINRQIDELLKKNEKVTGKSQIIRDNNREIIIDRLNFDNADSNLEETKVVERINGATELDDLEKTKVLETFSCNISNSEIKEKNDSDSDEIVGIFKWIFIALLIFLILFFIYYLFFK